MSLLVFSLLVSSASEEPPEEQDFATRIAQGLLPSSFCVESVFGPCCVAIAAKLADCTLIITITRCCVCVRVCGVVWCTIVWRREVLPWMFFRVMAHVATSVGGWQGMMTIFVRKDIS